MNPSLRSDLLRLLRAAGAFLCAALVFGALSCFVFWEAECSGNVVEGGPVELSQLAVLGCAALAYALRARAARDGRGPARAFALCALVLLAMCVRELDGFFDRFPPFGHSTWAVIDLFVLLAFAAVLFAAFSRSIRDLAAFAAGPEAPLFAAGLIFAVVFAQILGYKGIWKAIFDLPIWQTASAPHIGPDGKLPGDLDLMRHVKNTVEESIELGSYLLLLASALLPPALARRR